MADVTSVHNVLSHALQEWSNGVEIRLGLSTDHKSQSGVLGAFHTSADRCIVELDRLVLAHFGDLLGRLDVDGAAVDAQCGLLNRPSPSSGIRFSVWFIFSK